MKEPERGLARRRDTGEVLIYERHSDLVVNVLHDDESVACFTEAEFEEWFERRTFPEDA